MSRPRKLNTPTLLVLWGARALTLAEKVVCYRDWSLDQEGLDGCYAGPTALSAGLGGSLTPGTVSTLRQRLKRLGLHHAIDRGPGANVGWVTIVPPEFIARSARDAAALCPLLDEYIKKHDAGLTLEGGSGAPVPLEPQFQGSQNTGSVPAATALGGVGGASASVPVRQAQLTSAFREKRVGAHARTGRREREAPLTPEEMRDFLDGVARDLRDGRITNDQAALLRRVSGL